MLPSRQVFDAPDKLDSARLPCKPAKARLQSPAAHTSMLLPVARRKTSTGRVCPMRWHLSIACRSACGFLQKSALVLGC